MQFSSSIWTGKKYGGLPKRPPKPHWPRLTPLSWLAQTAQMNPTYLQNPTDPLDHTWPLTDPSLPKRPKTDPNRPNLFKCDFYSTPLPLPSCSVNEELLWGLRGILGKPYKILLLRKWIQWPVVSAAVLTLLLPCYCSSKSYFYVFRPFFMENDNFMHTA